MYCQDNPTTYPSSQPVINRPLSEGSNPKSITVVPFISTGRTPSGMRPGLAVSKIATFPPGPSSGTAILLAFANRYITKFPFINIITWLGT